MRAVLIKAGDLVKPAPLTKRVFRFAPTSAEFGLPSNFVGCPFVTRGGTGGRLVNEYLRDRFLNHWNPAMGRSEDQLLGACGPARLDEFALVARRIRGKKTAASSLLQICREVDDFVGWWEALASLEQTEDLLERLSIVREDLIQSYGDAMDTGEWSSDGTPLSTNTIRSRQINAIQFLRWAKHDGLAPHLLLSVIERGVQVASYSGAKVTASNRVYSIVRRPDPRLILFPDESEVRQHILNVLDPAAQLGTLLIYGCGLRLSEVVNLPKKCIRVLRSGKLKYLGVKGKGGRYRIVELESFIADQITLYVDFDRSVRAACNKDETPDRLLLRSDGTAFPPRALYRAFRKAGPISPHLGRHWYSVNFLLQAVQQRGLDAELPAEALSALLQPELIRLQRNLGHAHIETTAEYLVSVNQRLAPVNLFAAFEGRFGDA